MGIAIENTLFKSNNPLTFDRPSKHWKVIEKNSPHFHEEKPNSVFKPFSESDLQLPATSNTIHKEVIDLPSRCSPSTQAMIKLADPVDLRKEKENEHDGSMSKDNQLPSNKSQKTSLKLKFGIESILEKGSEATECEEKKHLNQTLYRKILQGFDRDNDTKHSKDAKQKSFSPYSDDSSTEAFFDEQPDPQLSPLFVEQYQQSIMSNSRRKMNLDCAKILSHHFHPYLPKNETRFVRNPSNSLNKLITSISQERNKDGSQSLDHNSFLNAASNRFVKSPSFQTVDHTSDENSVNLPSRNRYYTAKLKRSSPIYKSSTVINAETRSKSANSSPFDLMPISENFTKLESDGSSSGKLSPLLQPTPTKSNEHIGNSIRKRLTPEFDDVFNDNTSQKSLPTGHLTPTMMKQRYFPDHSHHPIPSPPGSLSVSEEFKQGEGDFFPPMNLHNATLLSPAFNAQFNFQSWQHALASTCHPSFRHLISPYSYNQTAALAMAAAMRQSFKNLPSQSVLQKNFADKNNFSVTDPRRGQPPFNDTPGGGPRKRRKWSRAVFSLMQRRGLEKSFQVQKYVAKPERKGLAEALGLTDAQVKIWFQNRRMKWRQEQKDGNKHSLGSEPLSPTSGDENPSHGELQ